MHRVVVLGIFICLGLAGVAFDLGSASARTWFSSHQFATSMATSLMLLGVGYLGIDYAIESLLRRKWMNAAHPALWQVLEAMIEVHEEMERELAAPGGAPGSGRALVDYSSTIDRHGPIMTATPDLGRIYALVTSHHRKAQQLDRIHRRPSIPSWDPVLELNDAASEVTSAIGSYLRSAVPAPPTVRARVQTLADLGVVDSPARGD